MFQLEVVATFEAAHQLHWHPGKCKELHGHTYTVTVCLQGYLHADGVVIDAGEVKEAMAWIINLYDHSCLNDYMPNPTAERIAEAIGHYLQKEGGLIRVLLKSVRVAETPTVAATWFA